ncbi:hypothetical protein pb186bvf_020744 [Paramecium bursaria]
MFQTQDISLILDSKKERGNLYLGSIKSIHQKYIFQHSIGAILSIQDDIEVQIQNVIVKQIIIQDQQNVSISQYFNDAFEFINNYLGQTNVLVHCIAGISRSSSFVIGFIMEQRNWTYQKAFEYVQLRRNIIAPNFGFADQLQLFYKNKISQRLQNIKPFDVVIQNQKSDSKGNLYIGSFDALKQLNKMKAPVIMSFVQNYKSQINQDDINYAVDDLPETNLEQYFDQVCQQVEKFLQSQNILILSSKGLSRSATIVIAYLMNKIQIRFNDAFKFLRQIRASVAPNEGFLQQLITYDIQLFK